MQPHCIILIFITCSLCWLDSKLSRYIYSCGFTTLVNCNVSCQFPVYLLVMSSSLWVRATFVKSALFNGFKHVAANIFIYKQLLFVVFVCVVFPNEQKVVVLVYYCFLATGFLSRTFCQE